MCDKKICDMPFDDSDITTYNPLQNKVSIHPEKKVKEYLERLTYNKFSFIDVSGVTRTCFKKFITLVARSKNKERKQYEFSCEIEQI